MEARLASLQHAALLRLHSNHLALIAAHFLQKLADAGDGAAGADAGHEVINERLSSSASRAPGGLGNERGGTGSSSSWKRGWQCGDVAAAVFPDLRTSGLVMAADIVRITELAERIILIGIGRHD